MRKALVIGYGSIGARHERVLRDLNCRTAIVSKHCSNANGVYRGIAQAITAEYPEYVVIANDTERHHASLNELVAIGYSGTVLIEKPLFDKFMPVSPIAGLSIYVAYNLRFDPIIQRLASLLKSETILSVNTYVGSYLPNWRPNSDYTISYSASQAKGGGALRDLSHELDYLTHLLGGWNSVVAIGGHLSELKIDSDDVFALLMTTPRCPIVSVQLNYLDRLGRRSVVVNTKTCTIEADLIQRTLTIDRESQSFEADVDYSYRAMHMEVFSGGRNALCDLSQGLEVLRLIESAEEAVGSRRWINRADLLQ